MIRAGILTISDKGAVGEREDTSGARAREMLESIGAQIEQYAIVPDERAVISARLREWADAHDLHLVVTTGGTGVAPRDVTPEATADVIERPVPGLAEMMRAQTWTITPMAALSRAVAGIRGRTLILNLPGSPKAVVECLTIVLPVLPHAVALLRGESGEHGS